MIFRDEYFFFNTLVNKIPGKNFSKLTMAVNVKGRVDVSFLQGFVPVTVILVHLKKDLAYSPVTSAQESLDVAPFGQVMGGRDLALILETILDVFNLLLQEFEVLKRNPLKRGKRLGNKRRKA